MNFNTKFWIVVVILALVLLVGSGALSVWICKIYDTTKRQALPPGVSPFPDVIPNVQPPATDPVINTCYKWCSDRKVCPDSVTKCNTQPDCDSLCTPPNEVTGNAVCTDGVCSPPYQLCITGFPLSPGTDSAGNPVQVADPSNLKKCITRDDCNVCKELTTNTDAPMNCVYVQDQSTVTLCDGNCQIQSIPQGYYCLPEQTGCNAHAGIATWTSDGWACTCKWNDVMSGPECNTMVACQNNKASPGSQAQQQLLVNCANKEHPLCGLPWVPESNIDPTGCYDKTKGFGSAVQCGTTNSAPNCVCQCDGSTIDGKGFTYDLSQPLTCQLDPCSNGAWGRSLFLDSAYQLNVQPWVYYTLSVVQPSTGYLTLTSNSLLSLTSSGTVQTKFSMGYNFSLNGAGIDSSGKYTVTGTLLCTNKDGSKVGDLASLPDTPTEGQQWVLVPLPAEGVPVRPDNLDNLVMYNPVWGKPANAQITDSIYNNRQRYLTYNAASNSFSLGPLENNANVVFFNRVDGLTVDNNPFIAQPFTNCACSGANSAPSLPACFDSNDNFVNFKSLCSSDEKKKCDETYTKNVSILCDAYTIPNSVVTIQPDPNAAKLCGDFKTDLSTLAYPVPSSTNMLPGRSNFVPGLNNVINPLTGVEQLLPVCTMDPCTGKYGDPGYSLQSNSGVWDPVQGQCSCRTMANSPSITNPSEDSYSFPVDALNLKWNPACADEKNAAACICNHITNPVCGVCQNACIGSPCKNSADHPCQVASDMGCTTDKDTGGPVCQCYNDCILVPGTGDVCMQKIDTGGHCEGLEYKPGVCLNEGDKCMQKQAAYTFCDSVFAGHCLACDDTNVQDGTCTRTFLSYCSSQGDQEYCWDSTAKANFCDPDKCDCATYNKCTKDGYEECPTT